MEETKKNNTKNKIFKHLINRTVICCLILTLIYFLSGYCKWIEIGVTVVAVFMFIFFSIQEGFCIFAYLHLFTLSNILYSSCLSATFVCYLIILTIKYIIGVKKNKYKVHKPLLFFILGFMFVSINISWFFTMSSYVIIYITYLPLFYIIFEMRKEFNIHQAMNFFTFGLFLSCGLAFIANYLPNYQYVVIDENRFRGFINCVNYLYMRAMLVLTYYMYKFLNGNIKTLKFSSIYIICSIIILATISKSAICLLALFTLIFLIAFVSKDFKHRIKFVLLFILVLALTSALSYKFILNIFDRFSQVSNSNNFLNKLTTGRDNIWKEYFNHWLSSPFNFLFGYGMFGTQLYIPNMHKMWDTHSFYLMLLYRFGLVGVIFLGFIIYLFIRNVNKSKPKYTASLPLLWFIIESIFDNTFKCNNIFMLVLCCMILFSNSTLKRIEDSTSTKKTEQ